MITFESFVSIRGRPTTKYHRSNFSHAALAIAILSLLSSRTRFILRLVSHAIKLWVDTEPSPLRYLQLTFPLSHYSIVDLQTFHRLSPQCWHLTVKLLPSATALPESASSKAKMPFTMLNLTSLTHLHIDAPMYDDFYPLLAFRLVLQAASVPNLSHMTISPLSLPGVMAMRWGPFTSFGETEWTGAHVWRGLTRLEVGLSPWHRDHIEGAGRPYENKEERRSAIRVQRKLGTRVLYDWLASFAASDKVEILKLWWYEDKGLNPLLLDILSVKKNARPWHSLKPVKWKGLRELWLGMCRVTQADVDELQARCVQLEELWVEDKFLDEDVNGKAKLVDETWWARVQLDKQSEKLVHAISDVIDNTGSEGVYAETVDFQDYEDDGGSSMRSLEVPLRLDLGNEATPVGLL